MSKFNTMLRLIKNDRKKLKVVLLQYFRRMKISHLMSDERYLEFVYRVTFDKELNLDNPQTFNEKLNWLKLNKRNPEYTKLVDKYDVKEYVSKTIGEEYIVPTLGVWDNVDEIDFESLPEQFVIKCTHDSGSTVVCKDKKNFDFVSLKKKFKKRLRKNMFWWAREWPYKNVKPRIIAEKLMVDKNQKNDGNLSVYKVFCFDGKPEIIQTIQNDKSVNETVDYFDTSWNILDMRQDFPNSKVPVDKPKTLDEMLSLSARLTTGFEFLRADFYEINGKVYFSELTFYSDAGMTVFEPREWDYKLGALIKLSVK